MNRSPILRARCLPTVDLPEPGRPTQAILKGYAFNGVWGDGLVCLECVNKNEKNKPAHKR
jgi:hypothetical protein